VLGPYQEQTRCSACMQVAVWCVPFAVCHVPCVSCALCPLCHEHMLHTPRSGLVSAAMKMTDALRGPQFVVSRPALQVLYFGAVCLSEGVPHPAPRSSPCPSPSPPPSHLTPHTSHLTPHTLTPHTSPSPPGDACDVTAPASIGAYHTLRAEGECSAASLSSGHLRSTDFESACNDENLDKFKANTRGIFPNVMTYLAGLHRLWEEEPNHERITPSSSCFLQFTREDMDRLASIQIDASAQIVTAIFDITTDPKTWHLCQSAQGDDKGKKHALELLKSMDDEGDLKAGREPDETEEDAEATATLAAQLMARKAKDRTPHAHVASVLGSFANRVAAAGKDFHLFLVGCNTISAVRAIHAAVLPEARAKVWVLCTSNLWPSDLSTFLWHLYGSTVQPDLNTFRIGTASLLQEYTHHYKRQRILDPSSREAGLPKCLASMVHMDRLDRVQFEGAWTDAKVAPL
jgi:hypothetical protein